jgi:hypothetical protein
MITYLGNDAYFVSFADITQRKMLEDTLMQKNADLEMISHSLETTNKKIESALKHYEARHSQSGADYFILNRYVLSVVRGRD